MKLEADLKTIERAEWYLLSRIEKIERRILEIEAGSLDAIVDTIAQQEIVEAYEKELKMYNYLKNLTNISIL